MVNDIPTLGPWEGSYLYRDGSLKHRGKDYELRMTYPTGESETVLKGIWDFNWQIGYQLAKPLPVPKGTKILAIAHYDNSVNNKFNFDPSETIWWGDQNWDEMHSAFLGLVFDAKTDSNKVFISSGPSLLPRGNTAGPTLAAVQATGREEVKRH